LLAKLREVKMPALMIPGYAFKVPELPKLGSGKNDFGAAKQLAEDILVFKTNKYRTW
jgi:acyl-[acyl-carrier-protein]-phospholipid O-acyltransferase / long-chain-fatty-acid--[acyl-carrier-protein] ligase